MNQGNAKCIAFHLLSLALAIALPTDVVGQEGGWYGGLSAGKANTGIDSSIVSGLQGGPAGSSRIISNDEDTVFKVLGGYRFNGNLALEASRFDLGEFGFDATLLPSGTVRGNASIKGFGLDLVGSVPLRGPLSAFARVGINSARIDQNFDSSGIGSRIASRSDRDVNEKYGIGLEYAFSEVFFIRAELERYRLDDNLVTDDFTDTFTAGFVYRFGARSLR